ncbi:T9SS type A sorting domain-containing protein [Lentimicrobium sp. L6]|uniref:T9SS type A sorting domain-containing protein n=1 Tax=Lentimicrobium sp. L6 TaxID=2735916 RepID=UPI0015558CBF|nr:T9SS type A sorting domain-containing protein [Lentimicrobium sp. L6]NPD83449.1 T9SS type A sorting domain-containing protein [Lentimicrobium sp. L6]
MKSHQFLFGTLLFISLFLGLTIAQAEDSSKTKSPSQTEELPLPTGYNTLFAGSGECLQCHNSMIDSDGNNIGILDAWKSTMMGNASKDPFWKAKVSFETIINPGLQEEIETTCTRCHAPQGNFEAQHNGQTHYSIAELNMDPLAKDGVSCTTCHQIMEESHGNFSGNIQFNSAHEIYGPYSDIFPNPMINTTGYTPTYSTHIKDSELCANCHTLLTPTVDLNGQLTGGEFVEQSVYQEWKNSESFTNGVSCQDCHLPEIDESIVISTMPPWLTGQTPFGKHELVGGNVFMLRLLRDNIDELELTAGAEDFDASISRTLHQLQELSLQLELNIEERDQDSLYLSLRILNYAGHKVPSGYPSRQVFVQLEVQNEAFETIFLSGGLDENFQIINEDEEYEPHYSMINNENQVQIYQTVMANVEDEVTTTLLHAAYPLKDNRLPPMGFSTSHPSYDTTIIAGLAASDETFNPSEQGGDLIKYHIPTQQYQGQLKVTAKVYYQTVGSKWLEDMFNESSEDIDLFEGMYEASDKSPVLMGTKEIISLETTINKLENLPKFYPNPSQGYVFIENNQNWEQIDIYHSNGQFISNIQLTNQELVKLELPQENGVYMIQLNNKEGHSEIFKILKI